MENKVIEQTDWALLAKYLSGDCSEDEQNKIQIWINSSAENQKTFELMKNVWQSSDLTYQPSDIKKIWNNVVKKAGIYEDTKIKGKVTINEIFQNTIDVLFPFPSKIRKSLQYAFIILLVVSIPYFLKDTIKDSLFNNKPVMTSLTIENGIRKNITLADSTKVHLDAGSKLTYPQKFNSENREVILNGEAYFEVAHNPEKPFIVHANNAKVEVLGTKFNIRAWEESKKVDVAVAKGKVSLQSAENHSSEKVILTHGLASSISEKGVLSKPQKIDIENELGWMNNEKSFHNASLLEILSQIKRWYNIDFAISNSVSQDEHLTIHLQNNAIEDIVEMLSVLTGYECKYVDQKIFINETKE